MKEKKLRIAITLPYLYSVRDFLFTPVFEEMQKRENIEFLLLTNSKFAQETVLKRISHNIFVLPFPPKQKFHWIKNLFFKFDDHYLYDSIMYRFAAVNKLGHYFVRKNSGIDGQNWRMIMSDYRRGESVAKPFPKSKIFLSILYHLREVFVKLCLNRNDIEYLNNLDLDFFCFGRAQLQSTSYWTYILKKLGTPMLGVISSWDHLTTKGCLSRGMNFWVVASKRMKEELNGLHGIDDEAISQVGKVQMDIYKNKSILLERESFLDQLGIPHGHKLVVFGPNTTGLNEHEVSIVSRLASDFSKDIYPKTTLVIRPHPQDINWKRDFLILENDSCVKVFQASSFSKRSDDKISGNEDQVFLTNLMKHSDLVIQSRGSLALDAIAFDTPVVSLGFDGDLKRLPNDSFLREYCFEHYKPLIKAEGTWFVGSYKELGNAIVGYLEDPLIHADGRKKIREEQIEPFDGIASKRLISCIVDSAISYQNGKKQDANWKYSGLGNTKWAENQICNIDEYLKI